MDYAEIKAFTAHDLSEVKRRLLKQRHECRQHLLYDTCRWLSELLFEWSSVEPAPSQTPHITESQLSSDECARIQLAHDLISCREYQRATHLLQHTSCTSERALYLSSLATYLSLEQHEVMRESVSPGAPDELAGDETRQGTEEEEGEWGESEDECGDTHQSLLDLRDHLIHQIEAKSDTQHGCDSCEGSFLHYLLALVHTRVGRREQAVHSLCHSIRHNNDMTCAWLHLSTLITTNEQMTSLAACLPTGAWMYPLFVAITCYSQLQLSSHALELFERFQQVYALHTWSYLTVQTALLYQNQREVNEAIAKFEAVLARDPYRVEAMDSYSNLLFVKGERAQLCVLARRLARTCKYSSETCCVLANYHSSTGCHERAVEQFARALRLQPRHAAVWTLMGHEYLELKNTHCAVRCYRQALRHNARDYRAWYGLGQTYEILRMPLYSQYYYWRAYTLRSQDSRMLMALAETFERLDRVEEARRCYWKAHTLGDIEGVAMLRLARLFERAGNMEDAACAYLDYMKQADGQECWDSNEQCLAYRFLANHFLNSNQLQQAHSMASKCLMFASTQEEAKAILREVAVRRTHAGADPISD